MRQFSHRKKKKLSRGEVESKEEQQQQRRNKRRARTNLWSDREGEIRWRKEEGGGGGSRSFCGFATQADRKIRNEWRSDTMQRSQAGREIPLSAPRYRQPPFAPCFSPPYLPSTFEPFTSNGEKRRKGADKRARRREEAGRFKESIDAWPETGWWAALPPPLFSLYRDGKLCKRPQGHRMEGICMWRIAGIRHESRGSSRSATFPSLPTHQFAPPLLSS